MYLMAQTLSSVPYSGAKGMLTTIFGLDPLGDDALAIKNALLKVKHAWLPASVAKHIS